MLLLSPHQETPSLMCRQDAHRTHQLRHQGDIRGEQEEDQGDLVDPYEPHDEHRDLHRRHR